MLFAALTVGWTWPLVLHLRETVPGDPGDNYSFLWNLWWMRHVLATPGLPYFHTSYLFYPFGTTIADHPHCALPALVAATLLKPLSIITAYNVLVLAFVFANMTAMYALTWTILPPSNRGQRRRAAILAAVIFGLSPYVAAHLLGHFDLIAVWVLPAFALALRQAVHGESRRAAVGAGVILSATAYIAYYYVVYLCLFTVAYVCAWAVRISMTREPRPKTPGARRLRSGLLAGVVVLVALAIGIVATGGGSVSIGSITISSRTPQNALTAAWLCAFAWIAATWRLRIAFRSASAAAPRRAVVLVAIVAATFAVGAAPLLREAASLIARGEYVSPRYGWRSAPRGIDVVAPLLGHPLHPLSRTASARAYDAVSADRVEAIAWVGIVPLLLLFFARGSGRASEEVRIWRVVAIVFLAWALGPFLVVGGFDTGLKLPEILARFVPLVANARMPGRAMVAVYMALALLVASGMARAAGAAGLRRPAVQWLAIAVVAFEYWDAPIHLTVLDRPAVYAALAAAPPGAVCEVPFGIGDGLSVGVGSQDRRVLFYATQHEHPLAGGYIGRMPARAEERYLAMPIAGSLLRGGGRVDSAAGTEDRVDGIPCRYLVVNRPASSAGELGYVQRLPADRVASDESRDLYRLR